VRASAEKVLKQKAQARAKEYYFNHKIGEDLALFTA
jgi:hypothetical protein